MLFQHMSGGSRRQAIDLQILRNTNGALSASQNFKFTNKSCSKSDGSQNFTEACRLAVHFKFTGTNHAAKVTDLRNLLKIVF